MYHSQSNQFLYFSSCEDSNGNLDRFIKSYFNWNDKTVLEAGIGLGRITDKYIDKAKKIVATDKSEKMLNLCKKKFSRELDKIEFLKCDHDKLYKNLYNFCFDTFISAYSLSYLVDKYKDPGKLKNVLDGIFSLNIKKFIVIESIGVFSKNDHHFIRYKNYFNYLYDRFSFRFLNTDFVFADNSEATYYAEVFFGKKTRDIIRDSGIIRIPETTCVWFNE